MSAAPMDPFTQAVMLAARKRVAEIMAEVAAKAETELRTRLNGVADQLALNVLQHYEASWDGHRLVITVKKADIRP